MMRAAAIIAWLRGHLLFSVMVLLPTLCSIIYYALIASDVYVSESHFVVSNAQSAMPSSGIESLLMGAGMSQGHGDSSEVRDYIVSRDALKELADKVNIKQIFGRPEASFIDRYPNLIYDKSFEELFKYYGNHVSVEPDPVSSISVLSVRAFTAEDARKINAQLLDMAERLVNALNDRSRQDTIRFSDNEVKIASEKAKDAAVALLIYRNNQTVFEPNKEAALQLEGIAKLHQQLITSEAEIAEVRKLSPDNPQIAGLESAADLLRKTIIAETGKVTSPNGSFSARAADFERLQLDVEFADRQLGMALAELENARADAQKKQIYLERLTQPSVQDKSMEPRRIRSILTVFIVSLLAWGVAIILAATVREHAE
jgi:capsular polysaccharide transport system permease protein